MSHQFLSEEWMSAAKAIREKVRKWVQEECIPAEKELDTKPLAEVLGPLRTKARARGLWCPWVPKEYGGMGLGPLANALVQMELGESMLGALSTSLGKCQAVPAGGTDPLNRCADQRRGKGFCNRKTGPAACGVEAESVAFEADLAVLQDHDARGVHAGVTIQLLQIHRRVEELGDLIQGAGLRDVNLGRNSSLYRAGGPCQAGQAESNSVVDRPRQSLDRLQPLLAQVVVLAP